MKSIFIIEDKDKRFCELRYSVGYCMDKLNYIYQSGIICDRTGADFSLSERIVGYALSESDFYNLGVEIAENLYCALCSLVRKGLHDETFAIIDSIYKMNKPNRAAPEGDPN